LYLVFDVGTTSVKTALYNMEGELIHKVIRDYSLNSPQLDWYEVDSETYWNGVIDGFKEIIESPNVSPHLIKSISGCSQGETSIFLDRDDIPLRPAIVWYDNRARKEVDELTAIINADEFYRTTGLLEVDTTWSAPKLLWVKNNEPDLFNRTRKILLVEEYIVYKFTGRFVGSASLSSSTALIDVHRREYWGKTVDYIEARDKLPEIIEEGSIVGNIKPEIADELGLHKDVIVVKGAIDQVSSALGAGNVKPGIITEITGSALAVVVTLDSIDLKQEAKLPYQAHVVKNRYALLPYAQTAAITYKWFRDAFSSELEKNNRRGGSGYERLNELARTIPPGSEGLVFLPFLAGASFPENDSYAKGVFYGITLKHQRAHFARSIIESIGFMLKKIMTSVEDYGVRIEEIHSMGGGARSDLWLQIKSDICNYRIVKMKEEDSSTLGAAILASVQAGDYTSIDEAVAVMVKKGKTFNPDKSKNETYMRSFALYNELYERLKPTFRKYSASIK
jgi:xylulokinase